MSTQPSIDPGWWDTERHGGRPIRQFLADRDIETLFQFLHRRGWSWSAIARATDLGDQRVREIASGKRKVVNYDVFQRIAAGLAIPNGYLGLGLDQPSSPAPESASRPSVSPAVVVSDPHRTVNLPDPVIAAAEASMRFARWASTDQVEQLSIDSLSYELARIATTYVHAPLQPLFADLQVLRDQVWRLLENRPHPNQARDLYFLGGVTVTLLAHATNNLGNAIAAMQQALAAERLAVQADHPGLRAWAVGTQALVAEWSGNPGKAVDLARRGEPYAPPGEQQVRLAALEARCSARLGRADDARDALRRASRAADRPPIRDDLQDFGGVLNFPTVKALYYAGSTYTLIGDYCDAERCAGEAVTAYESGPVQQRSYGDEALARADIAIARIERDDFDAAADALRPVFDLPAVQHIPQISDGLARVGQHIRANRHHSSSAARELSEEVAMFDTVDDAQGT